MKFLFIDDSINECRLIEEYARRKGLNVTVTADPTDFVRHLESGHYDYAVLDAVMPVDAGIILGLMKPYINGTKIYIMSGNVELAKRTVASSSEKIAGFIDKWNLFEKLEELSERHKQYT